jgi:outer membrane protein
MRNPISLAPSAPSTASRVPSFFRRLVGPLVAAGAVTGALLLAPSEAAAQSKIAVVDVQRAVLETEEGLRVQAALKKLFDTRNVELDTKQRALAQEKEELEREAQQGKTPKETLQRKAESFQKRALEFQALTYDVQKEMQRKQNELTTPIVQRILGIIRRIASQEGYEMVLEKTAVPYFRGDLEITDRAIQMYNGGQTGDAPAGGAPGTVKPGATKPGATTKPAAEQPKPAATQPKPTATDPKASPAAPKPAAPAPKK